MPDRPNIDFTFTIGVPIFGRQQTPPRQGQDRTRDADSSFVFEPTNPVFTVPRGPVTNPFGIPGFGGGISKIPQDADVVFRKNIAGRLFNIGGLAIFGLDIFIRAANKAQKKRIDEDFESLEELERARQRRRARDRDIRTIEQTADLPTINPDRPDLPLPDVISPVRIPRPEAQPTQPIDAPPQPAFPLEIEFPQPDFGTSQPPSPVRAPVEIPNPTIAQPAVVPEFPNPGQFELEQPVRLPDLRLFEFPFDNPFSVGEPQASPTDLTGPEPTSVPSGDAQPVSDFQPFADPGVSAQPRPAAFASPQADPTDATVDRCKPRKCDDELDEPRTECFKGLYREGVLDTDFTQWSEIDCLTGREL